MCKKESPPLWRNERRNLTAARAEAGTQLRNRRHRLIQGFSNSLIRTSILFRGQPSNRERILTKGLRVVHERRFADASVRDIVETSSFVSRAGACRNWSCARSIAAQFDVNHDEDYVVVLTEGIRFQSCGRSVTPGEAPLSRWLGSIAQGNILQPPPSGS